MEDTTILFQGVGLWGEGENGLVIGWQTREPELGQVVDEEVELGGHTSQTGLYEPGGVDRQPTIKGL